MIISTKPKFYIKYSYSAEEKTCFPLPIHYLHLAMLKIPDQNVCFSFCKFVFLSINTFAS